MSVSRLVFRYYINCSESEELLCFLQQLNHHQVNICLYIIIQTRHRKSFDDPLRHESWAEPNECWRAVRRVLRSSNFLQRVETLCLTQVNPRHCDEEGLPPTSLRFGGGKSRSVPNQISAAHQPLTTLPAKPLEPPALKPPNVPPLNALKDQGYEGCRPRNARPESPGYWRPSKATSLPSF